MGTKPRKRTSFCTPAFHESATQVGMLRHLVADDDELQIFELPFLFFNSPFSAAKASMMRTTFLCGLMRPA